MRADKDESLGESFWAIARQLRSATARSLAEWGITPGQSRALRVLLRSGALRLSELSERLRIAARSTTEVVDGLEEKGLVARRPDPDDRRATLVQATSAGEDLMRCIRAASDSDADRLFGRLSASEQSQLARLLAKLRE